MRSSYGIVRRETSTLSSDGHSWLRILVWLPDPTYTRRGVVQLVHGMSEHIGRYDDFARFLAGLGYVVFGHDHIGHGKSASSAKELGCMPQVGGKNLLIDDVMRVRSVLSAEYKWGSLSFFLFGHSMGSYIARVVAARYPQDLAGVVLCGAGNQPFALAKLGNVLANGIATLKGDTYRSSLLYSLVSGSFAAAISNPRTEFDWLSTDPGVVDAYCADPLCGARFSAGGYATLTDLVSEAVSKACFEAVPSALPLLFIAGEEDPVGSKGKGVQKAARSYQAAGSKDVEVILYPGMRHEVLNEPGKMTVYSDVESWLTEHAILHEIAQRDMQEADLQGAQETDSQDLQETDSQKDNS